MQRVDINSAFLQGNGHKNKQLRLCIKYWSGWMTVATVEYFSTKKTDENIFSAAGLWDSQGCEVAVFILWDYWNCLRIYMNI